MREAGLRAPDFATVDPGTSPLRARLDRSGASPPIAARSEDQERIGHGDDVHRPHGGLLWPRGGNRAGTIRPAVHDRAVKILGSRGAVLARSAIGLRSSLVRRPAGGA